METESLPNIKSDVRCLIQEAGIAGSQGGRPTAQAAYQKFSNQTGKVYIPVVDIWTRWTGRRMRFAHRIFKRAQGAADYSLALGNRYIRFVSYCKEAENEEV